MSRIFLIGPRASGKTSLGQALARALRRPFVDTDAALQERLGCSIADYVAAMGWDAFREEEHRTLLDVIAATGPDSPDSEPGAVVATGGGIVLLKKNRELLRENGRCFYLDVPVDELVRRLSRDPNAAQRPSLTGRDIRDEVAEVVRARDPLYREAAHVCLDGRPGTGRLCANVLSLLATRKNAARGRN